MTQKQSFDKSIEELLQTIAPKGIADESMRHTVEILLNLIEQLQSQVKELQEENQHLRNENNRLKGEQGKPDIKANKEKGFASNHSSEKERQTPKKHSKGSKNESIKIDRSEILVNIRNTQQLYISCLIYRYGDVYDRLPALHQQETEGSFPPASCLPR